MFTIDELSLLLDCLEDSATASEKRAAEARRYHLDVQANMATHRAEEKRALIDRVIAMRETHPDSRCRNGEDMTYAEWLRASGQPRCAEMEAAWRAGEDPTEYRA